MNLVFLNKFRHIVLCCIFSATFLVAKISIAEVDYRPAVLLSAKEFASHSKKVFAHYITQFPVSYNNTVKPDYYDDEYLNPNGEKGKHLSYGGYLRDRPPYRQPYDDSDWRFQDLKKEVELASNAGFDGFAWDMLSVDKNSTHWKRGFRLLEAAEINGTFKILLMPDMSVLYRDVPDEVAVNDLVSIVAELSKFKSVHRLDDGRILVSPFLMERKSPEFWQLFINKANNNGLDVALLGVFQGWGNKFKSYRNLNLLYGVSDWGVRDIDGWIRYWQDEGSKVHDYNLSWMMPVAPQDHRPKSFSYQEAGNFDLFRSSWENAINQNAEFVQVITWNDFSEHSHVAPSVNNGNVFLDLSAYYIQWYKTSKMPVITNDTLYYSYRKSSTSIIPKIQKKYFKLKGISLPRNEIELLAFIAEPGTLEIWIDGEKIASKDVDSGIQSLKTPVQTGEPVFILRRDGKVILLARGKIKIESSIDYENYHYYSGSANLKENTSVLKKPSKPVLN